MAHIFPFTQSWLPKPEPSFHPGTVEIALLKGLLQCKAMLIQKEASTSASAHHQRLWELGDVVEFFVQQVGESAYQEYQIAPNGMILALHYPDCAAVAAVRSGERKMEDFLTTLPIEGSASTNPEGWEATLTIPITGNELRLNCGRYDYSMGRPPVISSTSDLTERNFHRQQDWREITLVGE